MLINKNDPLIESVKEVVEGAGVDEHAAHELELYIPNTGKLQNQWNSIRKNLANKMADGKFDKTLAAKGFLHLVVSAAKEYAREVARDPGGWAQMFSTATRKVVAQALADEFEDEARDGDWDHFLNKKNQKAVGTLASKG
jgi:hypothetical protein